jgi:hypothetical protein
MLCYLLSINKHHLSTVVALLDGETHTEREYNKHCKVWMHCHFFIALHRNTAHCIHIQQQQQPPTHCINMSDEHELPKTVVHRIIKTAVCITDAYLLVLLLLLVEMDRIDTSCLCCRCQTIYRSPRMPSLR